MEKKKRYELRIKNNNKMIRSMYVKYINEGTNLILLLRLHKNNMKKTERFEDNVKIY
jgi:hypothetical protein